MNNDFTSQIKLYDNLSLVTKFLFESMHYCLNNKKLNNWNFDLLLRKYQALKIVSKTMEGHKEELKALIKLYNESNLNNDKVLASTYLVQIQNLEYYYVNTEIKLQEKLRGWQTLYCVAALENNQLNKESV